MRPSHEPAGTPLRAAQRATALAPMISKRRSERSPILEVLPSRSKVAAAPECVGRWGQSGESCGRHSPDARDGHQPTRHRILLGMPGDLAIEHSNALVQRSELLDQYGQNG